MATKVFLSYAREDERQAWRVYAALVARSVDVWFDRTHMKPGQWRPQIETAISQSRFFVVLLSRFALQRLKTASGYQETELRIAFKTADAQPQDRFTIVPVRLEDTDLHYDRLANYHQFDLFRDFEAVIGDLGFLLEESGDIHLVRSLQGKAYMFYQMSDFNRALSFIQSIEDLTEPTIETLNDRAATLHALGQYEDALKAIEKAIALKGDSSLVWTNRGTILNSNGERDEAEFSFRRAVELDQANTDAWLALGALHPDDEGLQAFTRVIDIDPTNARAHAARGIVLNLLGRSDDALAASEEAVKLDPEIATPYETIGMILQRRGRFDEAMPHLDNAIALGSNVDSVHYAKGEALFGLGQFQEAADCLHRVLQINPNHAKASSLYKLAKLLQPTRK